VSEGGGGGGFWGGFFTGLKNCVGDFFFCYFWEVVRKICRPKKIFKQLKTTPNNTPPPPPSLTING